MDFTAYRITSYKSIVDTEWCTLADGITVLIGQNESGKSSVLEALAAFDGKTVDPDSRRLDSDPPFVGCEFTLGVSDYSLLDAKGAPDTLLSAIRKNGNKLVLARKWSEDEDAEGVLELSAPDWQPPLGDDEYAEDGAEGDQPTRQPQYPSLSDMTALLYTATPRFRFFSNEPNDLLPATMDLNEYESEEKPTGHVAVSRFLAVSGLTLEAARSSLTRRRSHEQAASTLVTERLKKYWTQRIANSDMRLICSVENWGTGHAHQGEPYLAFYVEDGAGQLHPHQRSDGFRWYLSFFLALENWASETPDERSVVLIDEPGSRLHASAQKDLLKFLDSQRGKSQIIYTTHSPYLIPMQDWNRLRIVERREDKQRMLDTRVTTLLRHTRTKQDALSPIFTAIGMDLSDQAVIPKSNNVLLEEPSAHYYLEAFWHLCDEQKQGKTAFFLPATGATKVETLANLFAAWGLEFVVLLDGDAEGKKAAEKILSGIFADEPQSAARVLNLPDGKSIEDLFFPDDFKKYVLGDAALKYTVSNSQYMKDNDFGRSAAAAQFLTSVKAGKVKLASLHQDTRGSIRNVLKRLRPLLT